VNIRL